MRGARGAVGDAITKERIIPAYAGSTLVASSTAMSSRDHPRVCGEHALAVRVCCPDMGSSPRMRGAHSLINNSQFDIGIIPAYAGSTRAGRHSVSSARDHPRVCGEHRETEQRKRVCVGSSPRMRGAHFTKCIASIVKSNSYTVVKVQSTVRCYNFSYPQVQAADDRYGTRTYCHSHAATCHTS